MGSGIIGFIFALLAAFSWALAATFYRRALLEDVNPLVTNLLRIPLALVFLVAYSSLTGELVYMFGYFSDFRVIAILFIATFIMNVIGDTTYLLSIRNVGVSVAYPISYSYPLLVALIASFFLDEKLYLSLFAGTFIAIIGIWLLSKKNKSISVIKSRKKRFIIGILSAFCASLSWSIGIVIFKISVMKVKPISVAIIKLILLFIMVSPSIKINYSFIKLNLNRVTLLFALIGGLFGIGIGDFFFYMSLNNIDASISAALTTVSPLFTLLLAVIYLREEIKLNQVIGTTLIVLGVTLVYFRPF